MKDGRIVQSGMPEDIVTRLADDYVRAFDADGGSAGGGVDPVHRVRHPAGDLVCALKDRLCRSTAGAGFHADHASLCRPYPGHRFLWHRQAARHHRHADFRHAAGDPADHVGPERRGRGGQRSGPGL